LEEVVVALGLMLGIVLVLLRHARRQTEAPIFVDDGELSDDIVMEAVEGNHESAHPRRLADKAPLGERVGLQKPILECSHFVLLFLAVAV